MGPAAAAGPSLFAELVEEAGGRLMTLMPAVFRITGAMMDATVAELASRVDALVEG